MKPHPQAEFIKAWADGKEIEYQVPSGEKWWPFDGHWRNDGRIYRIKPDAPKWPQTSMSLFQLSQVAALAAQPGAFRDSPYMDRALKAVADATIAHECAAGTLVPKDKVVQVYSVGNWVPASMLEKVAEAVMTVCLHQQFIPNSYDVDLRAIIASVLKKEQSHG